MSLVSHCKILNLPKRHDDVGGKFLQRTGFSAFTNNKFNFFTSQHTDMPSIKITGNIFVIASLNGSRMIGCVTRKCNLD